MAEETDRTVLLIGLAQAQGSTQLKPGKNLMLGNLELIFDKDEKLERLRILLPRGEARLYLVREPKENLGV